MHFFCSFFGKCSKNIEEVLVRLHKLEVVDNELKFVWYYKIEVNL